MTEVAKAFWKRLRGETAMLHKVAERSGFNVTLFRGKATREGYGTYLRHRYQLYAALEGLGAEHADLPGIVAAMPPELARRDAVKADLTAIAGPDAPDGPMLDTVAAHIARMRELAAARPLLLTAHAYSLYFADLSGGPIIRRVLAEQYGYGDGELRAYAFADVADPEAFKQAYRERLHDVLTEHGLEEDFVAEVKLVFIFAAAALLELDFACIPDDGRGERPRGHP